MLQVGKERWSLTPAAGSISHLSHVCFMSAPERERSAGEDEQRAENRPERRRPAGERRLVTLCH